MSILLAFQYQAPAIYKMDSGYGVPIGVVLVLAILANFIVSSVKQDPKIEAENRERDEAASRRQVELKREAKNEARLRETGKILVRIINDTAARTGRTPEKIVRILMAETTVPLFLSDGKLNVTTRQLELIQPRIAAIKTFCDGLKVRCATTNSLTG